LEEQKTTKVGGGFGVGFCCGLGEEQHLTSVEIIA